MGDESQSERCPECGDDYADHSSEPGPRDCDYYERRAPTEPTPTIEAGDVEADRCGYCDTDQLEPDTGICHRCYEREQAALRTHGEAERLAELRDMWDWFVDDERDEIHPDLRMNAVGNEIRRRILSYMGRTTEEGD